MQVTSASSVLEPEALRMLTALVRRRSSVYLSSQDIEDISMRILADAWASSRKSGAPLTRTLFAYCSYSDYYRRARELVFRDRSIEEVSEGVVNRPHQVVSFPGCPLDFTVAVDYKDIVDRMSEPARSIYIQCDLQGYTINEVAKARGVSVGTVHRHLASAREKVCATWQAA